MGKPCNSACPSVEPLIDAYCALMGIEGKRVLENWLSFGLRRVGQSQGNWRFGPAPVRSLACNWSRHSCVVVS